MKKVPTVACAKRKRRCFSKRDKEDRAVIFRVEHVARNLKKSNCSRCIYCIRTAYPLENLSRRYSPAYPLENLSRRYSPV